MSQPRFTPALDNLPLLHQGKTRDTFSTVDDDHLLVVATKRLSTHDVIHASQVPNKDYVLTALTVFWSHVLKNAGIRHHVVAYGKNIFEYLPKSNSGYPGDLYRRAIVVKKLEMIPVEFIYRAYLAGSLYRKFYKKNVPNPYGIDLKPGLEVMTPFSVPLFTPTDKSETDDPLNSAQTEQRFPEACRVGKQVFNLTRNHLQRSQLDLVDSKFELGVDADGNVVVGDEIVTPDSSRFARLSDIKPGSEPPWFDKQIGRDEAERIWGDGPKRPLEFGPEVIQKLSDTYLEIFSMITGSSLYAFTDHRLG